MKPRAPVVGITFALALVASLSVRAHSGPPYPIVSNRVVGPYSLSVWTDPDATDDGSARGQFWVVLNQTGAGPVPSNTRVQVSIAPLDRQGTRQTVRAEPVKANASRQFGALTMDHEGRYSVRVDIDGPLGEAGVDADVEATYDLRPTRLMIIVYLMPFVLVGFLWVKLLLRRRFG